MPDTVMVVDAVAAVDGQPGGGLGEGGVLEARAGDKQHGSRGAEELGLILVLLQNHVGIVTGGQGDDIVGRRCSIDDWLETDVGDHVAIEHHGAGVGCSRVVLDSCRRCRW